MSGICLWQKKDNIYPEEMAKVSLVLPAFNEKENLLILIPAVINLLEHIGRDYEVILVDDGSTDGTPEIADDFAKVFPAFKYIRLKFNKGLASALVAGYNISTGDTVITMDSDLQYDLKDIPKLLNKLAEYDLVCCWRQNRADSFLKRASSGIANHIRRMITKDNFDYDGGCIFRGLRRQCLSQIEIFDGFHRFLPLLFRMKGFKVGVLKVRHFPRKFGRSKHNIRNRVLVAFLDALLVFWLQKRQIDYEVVQKINC